MAKRYLITGGAGFLGINLIRFILNEGEAVTSLDFADFDYPDVLNQVKVIKGDIRDKGVVDRAMEDIDIVVHAAAALPLYKKSDIFSIDIEGTRNVVESAYRHRIERLIHISSTAVYGIPIHHPIFEDDELKGVGPYGQAKITAEEICLEYRKRGMCIPIIRPKSFIGPERLGVFAIFYDWVKDGRSFPVIGNGKNRYQLLDVEDLCQVIYLTATKEKDIVNDTFNIGAKEFTTMKEDFQVILDCAGFGKKIKTSPAWAVIFMLKVLELLRLSPLYKWVYETAPRDSFVSTQKAENILGFAPKYSNKDALLRNYKWYLNNLSSFKESSGISHRVPWKQGALKFAKVFF
ncbi:MAG: NAD-dependent epimerase/dehydratase family protein [Candidatus Omnitrophica bacterium]|nr:NAD-dependent epimerase/dehydratase family protein [Candidatus Omnitrophota bacterium]MBU0878535.1 NAD-dependent epimerase/dehydratase family protein [Candidatus Omnitrophota bacterium]MBU0897145.1 NAD-dependent epimerase/dehydratase family protein [Candidatus Omnitrophota bacterium]MBU1133615.1 NAD-dependent epimerase/dehydratase family protein [Candidatus Omnitrophota bacterium]MBU1810390.1 NAD-dependent epimerase/dehydratase family protein [Candidatus Omnitrophota bacterium]